MALAHDVRTTLRGLRRTPVFTVAALSCLALGIGATTAIFSVVNAVLLRPLPYKTPERLARLYTEWPTWPGGAMNRFWTSGPEFLEMRRDLKSWRTLDAWQIMGVNVTGSSEPARATGCLVSGKVLKGSLYGIEALEPAPFVIMAALLTVVTLLACLGPALRATRVDPLAALRYE